MPTPGRQFSRPDYDKPWRCPGWSGSAFRGPQRDDGCESGSLASVIDYSGRWWWRTHRCPTCGLLVLPVVVRNVDPSWWRWRLSWWWGEFTYWWSRRG